MLMHIAYVIILASFLVKDVLWLRVLSVVGGFMWVAFFATLQAVDWGGIGWNVFFGLINLWHIAKIIAERRPVQLSERERELKRHVCPELSDRRWLELLEMSERFSNESSFVIEGKGTDSVYLLSRGQARASRTGEAQTLSSGEIIGGVSYLTGHPSHERVECDAESELLKWSTNDLRAHLEQRPEVLSVFQRLVAHEIARQHRYL